MGGRALQQYGIETERFSQHDYFEIVNEVCEVLESSGFVFAVVQAYRTKESFGDMDVVIQNDGYNDEFIKSFITLKFKAGIIHRNTNTYSFAIRNFQIDFIFQPPEVYSSTVDYYDFSPSGNAVGKLCHQFKLTYGHEGLKYIIREEDVGAPSSDNSHVLKEVILTNDLKTIHRFLYLDHERYEKGFDTEEEIFEWVCSSTFFSPELFSFENMNHRARVRDVKRPDYNRLMEWIEANKKRLPSYQRNRDKSNYLPWITATFPQLVTELEKCAELYKENQEIKEKFNGNIVTELTGKTGKDLGEVMVAFKKHFDDDKEKYRSFLLNTTKELVSVYIKDWYKHDYSA